MNIFAQFESSLLPYAFGKKDVVRLFEVALLTGGHVLIEDLPGVGKTTFAKAFAALSGKTFSRIQGTSDLLPSDIVGGEIVNLQTKEISLKKGPIFSELVLIDEINRMHPKTQSAFLEAMEEKTVTLAGEKFFLPAEHMILATQNPIEQAGTNVLPEAQRDRFACKISLGFPSEAVEQQMVQNMGESIDAKILSLNPLFSGSEISDVKKQVAEGFISESIAKKLVQFAHWTREDEKFQYGISLRGMQIFANAMRAHALLEGRDFVIPEDGISLLFPFLAHRIEFHEPFSDTQVHKILLEKYEKLF